MEATPGPAALEARRGGVQLGISRSGRDCGSPCRFSCHQPGGSRSPLGTLSAAGPDHSPLACPAATASPGSLYASTKPAPARSPGGRNPRSRARARPASRPQSRGWSLVTSLRLHVARPPCAPVCPHFSSYKDPGRFQLGLCELPYFNLIISADALTPS